MSDKMILLKHTALMSKSVLVSTILPFVFALIVLIIIFSNIEVFRLDVMDLYSIKLLDLSVTLILPMVFGFNVFSDLGNKIGRCGMFIMLPYSMRTKYAWRISFNFFLLFLVTLFFYLYMLDQKYRISLENILLSVCTFVYFSHIQLSKFQSKKYGLLELVPEVFFWVFMLNIIPSVFVFDGYFIENIMRIGFPIFIAAAILNAYRGYKGLMDLEAK